MPGPCLRVSTRTHRFRVWWWGVPLFWPFLVHLVLLWGLTLGALGAALGGAVGTILWALGRGDLLRYLEIEPFAAPIIMLLGAVVGVPAGMGSVYMLLAMRGRRRVLVDGSARTVRESLVLTLPLLPWPWLPVAWRTWRVEEFDRVEVASDGLRLRGAGESAVLVHRAFGRRNARRHGEDLARICGLPLVEMEAGGHVRDPQALDEPLAAAVARTGGPPPAPLAPDWLERSEGGRRWSIRGTPAVWLRPLLIALACGSVAAMGYWWDPAYPPSPHEGLGVEDAAVPSLWPWRLHQAWVWTVHALSATGLFAAVVSTVWTLCLLAAHRRWQEVRLEPGRIVLRRALWPRAGVLDAAAIEDVQVSSREVLLISDRRWLRLELPDATAAPAVRDALIRHLAGVAPWAGDPPPS